MDTIFDKPLNKELNDKPDYATEMPMSSSDSTTVSQAIANVQNLFSQTPSQPTPLNSRCTITNGGYIIIGKICFISVKISGAYTATNVPLIMKIPNISCNEGCLSCEQHESSTSEAIPCYIDSNGRIGVGSITSGKLYNISGIAFIS